MNDLVRSDDAGGYYCEHALWRLLALAEAPGTPIRKGFAGPLVGFLHVPADARTFDGHAPRDPVRTVELVATAVRAFVDQATHLAEDTPTLRVLVAGFGPFRDVVDNPTGALAGDARLLEGIAAAAFPGGAPAPGDSPRGTVAWSTEEAGVVAIRGVVLDVTDDAVRPGGQLERAVAEFAPHAILALGVIGRHEPGPFRVEVRATNRNWDGERHAEAAATEVRTTEALAVALGVAGAPSVA